MDRFTRLAESRPSSRVTLYAPRRLIALSLLFGGCADLSDPFETFYGPGYQNTISTTPLYTGPPLSPRSSSRVGPDHKPGASESSGTRLCRPGLPQNRDVDV
jgi:hypothetical protein